MIEPSRPQKAVEFLLPHARMGNPHAARAVYLLVTASDPEAVLDQLCVELVPYALALRPIIEPWLAHPTDWAGIMMRDAVAHAHAAGRN